MKKVLHLYETHAHTKEVSGCAHVTAADMVKTYISLGYAGVVVTDHFDPGTVAGLGDDWASAVRRFMSGYEAAKAAAGERLTILFGMELRFHGSPNDYLVYGADESFLRDHPDIFEMRPRAFSALAREMGLLFIQAHPFRNGMHIVPPEHLDGIEIYNGNPRHDSRNCIAKEWAARFNLFETSGSDFHEVGDEGRGGIYCEEKLRNISDFIAALRGRRVSLKAE